MGRYGGGIVVGVGTGSGPGRYDLLHHRQRRERGALDGRPSCRRRHSRSLDRVLAVVLAEVVCPGVCVRWPLLSDAVMALVGLGILEHLSLNG